MSVAGSTRSNLTKKLVAEVGIVGAGLAGIAAAKTLSEAGVDVLLLEQDSRPGGRLASHRYHDRQFDYGAQYLKPHSRRSAVLFSAWRKAGLIVPWQAQALELPQRAKVDTSSWHVAVPSQSALAVNLAQNLNFEGKFAALDVSGERGRWSIIGHRNVTAGPFKAVFVTCPLEQTCQILAPHGDLLDGLDGIASRPCFAAMVEFEEEVMVDFDAAFVTGSPLAWVCRDSSKPQRAKGECWVFHAGEEWSLNHLDKPPEWVASQMLSAFAPLVYSELPPVTLCRSHRWRFARTDTSRNPTHRWNPELALGLAGDWCNTPNLDGAYWSGVDLAQAYLAWRES